jgi:PAS domain S-box-containing protein
MQHEIHKTILQNAPVAFALHQIIGNKNSIPVDYRFLEVNKAFEQFTGLCNEDIIGKTVTEVFPANNKNAFDWIAAYGDVAQSGRPVEFEQYFEPLQRWYKVEAFSANDDQFATFFTNISETKAKEEQAMKLAEQREEEGEDKIRTLIEAMPDMIFVMHRDGTVLEIFGAIPEQLIAPDEQLIGASIKNCFEPDEFNRHIQIYKQCIEKNENGLIEFELTINGKRMYFESRVQPLDNERLLTVVRDKTGQKQLLERISDGFVAFDAEMNYTFVNEAGGRMLGRNPNDLIGKNYWVEFPEAKCTPFADAYISAIKNQETIFIEKYYEPWKRWFSNAIYPSPNGISIIFQEITDRKMAELSLKESLDNFNTFFNSSIDFHWVLDRQGNILQMNDTARRRLGYDEKELIGKSVLMVHPPTLRKQVQDIVTDMLEGKKQNCPIPLQAKDGTEIPVETYVFEGRWNGQPALFGVSRDISALKMSEEKFAKAFHISPNMIGLSDMNTGEYLEVNQAFYDIMEYSPEEIKGKKVKDLVRMEPAFREKALAMLKEKGSVRNLETTLFAKSGKPVHVLLSADIIKVNEKEYNFTTGVNITKRKNIENALEDSEKRYAFLANTATELAGLATAMDIYAYTAKKINQLLNGHSILAIVEFYQNADRWKMKHIEGIGKWINDLTKLLGFDIRNLDGELSTKYLDKIVSGSLVEIDFDFPGLFNNKVSDLVGNTVKKLLSVEKMYCITFQQNNHLLGNITFTTNKKTGTVNSGLIEAFVSLVSNFLNRLLAEEEHRKSESRYHVYVDNAPLGVFVVDQNGKYLEVNDEACRSDRLLCRRIVENEIY